MRGCDIERSFVGQSAENAIRIEDEEGNCDHYQGLMETDGTD